MLCAASSLNLIYSIFSFLVEKSGLVGESGREADISIESPERTEDDATLRSRTTLAEDGRDCR